MTRAVSSPKPKIEATDYRQVLGHYPTGVCVITARQDDGTQAGMAVSSFTSVSLDPPLVAFFPDKNSSSWPKIEKAGRFCVNILAADQEWICRRFASKAEDKFEGVPHHVSAHHVPVLDGVIATIECEIQSVIEAGDHYIVLGHVLALNADRARPPLLFFQSGYGQFQTGSIG